MTGSWSTPTRVVVLVIILVLLAVLAFQVQPLLGPLVIAGLLAYTLNLGVRFVTNRSRLSRKWAVNLVYFIFLTIVIATPSTLVPITVNQAQALSTELEEVRQQIETVIQNPITVGGVTIPVDQLWHDLTNMTTDFGSAFSSAVAVVETTSVNLLRLLIIIVVSYFLLTDWHGLRDWLMGIIPESGREDAKRLLKETDHAWRAYMQGTLALMLIMGIFFIVVGLIIGLPGAVAIGLFTGFLSMIPELGPWISGAIAVAIAYFAGSNHLPISNFWFAVLVAGIYLVVTQLKSIWLRPQVMGRFMRMNTGVVFLAIIAAAMLSGILAALIILPIIATIGIIGRYFHARLLNLDPWPAKTEEILAVDPESDTGETPAETDEENKRLQSV